MLNFVDTKNMETQDIKNGSIIELEFEETDPTENDDGKFLLKTRCVCNVCSMSFASKDILDFHTEVK